MDYKLKEIVEELKELETKLDSYNKVEMLRIIKKVENIFTPDILIGLDKVNILDICEKEFENFLIRTLKLKDSSVKGYFKSLVDIKEMFEESYLIKIPFELYHVNDLNWFVGLKTIFELNGDFVEKNLKWHHSLSAAYNNYIRFLKSKFNSEFLTISHGDKKIYYNSKNKVIGRIPTGSNLKTKGSDNSLYFGMISLEENKQILCDILDFRTIEEFNKKDYIFKGYSDRIKVKTNINNQGQLQIKIAGDGTMANEFKNFQVNEGRTFDSEKTILFLDFKTNKIFFKHEEEANA